jgi:hypothetical protein
LIAAEAGGILCGASAVSNPFAAALRASPGGEPGPLQSRRRSGGNDLETFVSSIGYD